MSNKVFKSIKKNINNINIDKKNFDIECEGYDKYDPSFICRIISKSSKDKIESFSCIYFGTKIRFIRINNGNKEMLQIDTNTNKTFWSSKSPTNGDTEYFEIQFSDNPVVY